MRRTLDTSAGVRLTGEETIATLQAAKEAAEEEERGKKQRVEDRKAKKAENELAGERRAARLIKRVAVAAVAAAKVVAKEERRRKAAEAAEEADRDKENVSPYNVTTAVCAAVKPARYVCAVVKRGGGSGVEDAKE